MNVKRMSKSLWERFLLCPCHADLEHNQGLGRDRRNESAARGARVHELMAAIRKGKSSVNDLFNVEKDPETCAIVLLAVGNDPFRGRDGDWSIEERIELNESGEIVPYGGVYIGILDRMGIIKNAPDVVEIEDLKTSKMHRHSEFETHMYVWLASRAYPNHRRFAFTYFYPVVKQSYRTEYTIEDGKLRIQHFGWDHTLLTEEVYDYDDTFFLQYFKTKKDMMEGTDPDPSPGWQCENWYGSPCPFLDNECPVTRDMLTSNLPAAYPKDTPFAALTPEQKSGFAFQSLLRGYPIEQAEPDMVAAAYHGVSALRAACNSINALIKKWVELGRTFRFGQDTYGIVHDLKIDQRRALEMLAEAGVELDDLAKAVSVSKTGLNRLPRKKYGDLAERIISETSAFGSGKLGRVAP